MNGRQETDQIILNRIEKMLEDAPRYLKNYSYRLGKSKTAATKYVYLRYLLDFFDYIRNEGFDISTEEGFNRIKPMDMEKYRTVQEEKNGTGAVIAKLAAISGFLDFLEVNEYITRNPCDKIDRPKERQKINDDIVALTEDEIAVVKANMERGVGSHRARARQRRWNKRDLAIFTLGCNSGLRVHAISCINMDDIDFERRTIRVYEKGEVEKEQPVSRTVIEYLKEWCFTRDKLLREKDAECNALFISNRRTRMSDDSIRDIIEKYTRNIPKHITPHKMRSTCATILLDKTDGDIYTVQEMLGHRNVNTTKRYAKVSVTKKRRAADLMAF